MSATRIVPILLTILFALAACIPLTHCTDEPPVAPPDTTTPPPPRDTTSHEFTWELHKIGDTYGQMNDVWAIDDDHAIAVGSFVWVDSAGTSFTTTDLVELKDGMQFLSMATWTGIRLYNPRSCFATSDQNIWIAGGSPFKRTDTGYISYLAKDIQRPPWGGTVLKMWGKRNSDDVYLTCGNVIQRVKDGKIKTIVVPEDHPEIAFYRIWGEENGDVLAIGNDKTVLTCYIYRIRPDDTWEIIRESPSYMYGPWCYNGVWYFTDYGDIVTWDGTQFRWMLYDPKELSILVEVDGNHENDVFLVEQYGKVLHWNGSTWEIIYKGDFGTIQLPALSVTENAVYVSGYAAEQQPVILVGKRKK